MHLRSYLSYSSINMFFHAQVYLGLVSGDARSGSRGAVDISTLHLVPL